MNKYALITGCSKGIGKEIALELARYGYNIIGTYNSDLDGIKDLQNKIERIGLKIDYYNLNLLNDDNIDKFLKNIKEKYDKIDLLVNNASLSLDNELEYKTSDEFIDVLKVNLVGPFTLIKNLKEVLDGGIIINIASTDGINTYTKLNIDYSASKAGLINLTKSLSLILNNIKVVAICPNWVDTESIKEMNQDYLKEQMKRINQRKLIKPIEVASKIMEVLNSNIKSGEIVVMEDSNE